MSQQSAYKQLPISTRSSTPQRSTPDMSQTEPHDVITTPRDVTTNSHPLSAHENNTSG